MSSLSPTPYDELVCVSSAAGTCRVWDRQGALLCDVSGHVTRPVDAQATPCGILVVLGSDPGSPLHGARRACLTLLSPSGSLLGRLPLPSPAQSTRVHCQGDCRVLVSDEAGGTVTLYAIERGDRPRLRPLRQASHRQLLRSPRHASVSLTGDWLVNDGGFFLRAVSPEGEVVTVLTEDEPGAALLPPPRRASRYESCGEKRRHLTSVCCDSRGRVLAADVGKNGIYVATAGSSAHCGHRHFVSLQEVTSSSSSSSSSSHLTAMTVDQHDRVIVGLSDGSVCVLKFGSED